MNYIKQINAFWELERERGDFTAHLQSFYFAMLYYANYFRKREFSLYREDITSQAKLSNNTYYQVREQAKKAGLIDFKEGVNKRSKCTFTVLLLYQIQDTKGTVVDTLTEQEEDTACDHTHKHTKEINLQTDKQQTLMASPEGEEGQDQEFSKYAGILPEDTSIIHLKPHTEVDGEAGQPLVETVSQRQWEKKYFDTWWEFYKKQNDGEEPPHSWRNHYTLNTPLKKIQQDLAAVFDGVEENGYQEFVSILDSWPKLRNYHRLRLKPEQIHKDLSEIRMFLRENTGKTQESLKGIPLLGEALEIFSQTHLKLRQFAPNVDERYDVPQLGKTLEYLKSLRPDGDWAFALQQFRQICHKWAELEKADKFYEQCFTLKYIHGNTSKILTALQAKQPAKLSSIQEQIRKQQAMR